MRVTTDQFVGDGPCHIFEIEGIFFLGHAGVKHHLEQQVAQFLAK